MILKYTLLWIPMVFLAILNGIFRGAVFMRFLPELHAHQASTVTLILLFTMLVGVVSKWWRFESARQAFFIGLIWLVLTVVFEFTFGHFVAGHPWDRMFQDYNLLAGRVWILILIWIMVLPSVLNKLRS